MTERQSILNDLCDASYACHADEDVAKWIELLDTDPRRVVRAIMEDAQVYCTRGDSTKCDALAKLAMRIRVYTGIQ